MLNGPNLTTDSENLFQSDRDLALKQQRNLKRETLKSLGNPISLPSKILTFKFISPLELIVAQSGFIAQRIDIDGNVLATFKGHKGPVTSLAFDNDQQPRVLYTGSWDKTIKKWNIETGELIDTFTGHNDFVKSLAVFGNRLYSASTDSRIGVWDLETGESIDFVKGHRRSVEDVLITPDGSHLYSCSSDGTVRKWDLKTLEELSVFEGHQTSVYKLFGLWDDDTLWSVSGDKTAIRWDLQTGKKDTTLQHPDFVKSITVLPSGHIVTGCRDEHIRVFDPATEKCIARISAHFDEVSCIDYQSGFFYTASLDCTLRKWQLPSVLQQFVHEEIVEVIENLMTADEERELAELMEDD